MINLDESKRDPSIASEQQTTLQIKRLWNAWLSGEQSELNRILHEDPSIEANATALADLVYFEFKLRHEMDPTIQ